MIYLSSGSSRVHAKKGFSLLELVLVATIASLIFLFVIRWLLTLSSVSANRTESSAATRNSQYAQAFIASDVSAATLCGFVSTTPVRTFNSQEVGFFANKQRADGQLGTVYVLYRSEPVGSTGQQALARYEYAIEPKEVTLPVGMARADYGTCENPESGSSRYSQTRFIAEVNRDSFAFSTTFTPTSGQTFDCVDGQATSTARPESCALTSFKMNAEVLSPGSNSGQSKTERFYSFPTLEDGR